MEVEDVQCFSGLGFEAVVPVYSKVNWELDHVTFDSKAYRIPKESVVS